MAAAEGRPALPPRHTRLLTLLSRKPMTATRAAQIIASVTVLVTVLSGVLIHWADKRSFPNIGDGFWWAVQTVTTVGYGDVVPTNTVGQLMGALVMIIGIGFLTVITAAITSTFVEAARRRFQVGESEHLHAKLDEIGARLAAIEQGLRGPRPSDGGEPSSGSQ